MSFLKRKSSEPEEVVKKEEFEEDLLLDSKAENDAQNIGLQLSSVPRGEVLLNVLNDLGYNIDSNIVSIVKDKISEIDQEIMKYQEKISELKAKKDKYMIFLSLFE
ncbi:MAG: hypothetical protein DRJ63_05930 [Thermoprotei archaeon]|nr:MAG: hypothetical protein DRJ63_05930 [Thermoprotei archaeon]